MIVIVIVIVVIVIFVIVRENVGSSGRCCWLAVEIAIIGMIG